MSTMTRRLGLIAWLLALFVGGCSQETEYKVGQTIEMGPFAFVVEDAYERVSHSCEALGDVTRFLTLGYEYYTRARGSEASLRVGWDRGDALSLQVL